MQDQVKAVFARIALGMNNYVVDQCPDRVNAFSVSWIVGIERRQFLVQSVDEARIRFCGARVKLDRVQTAFACIPRR